MNTWDYDNWRQVREGEAGTKCAKAGLGKKVHDYTKETGGGGGCLDPVKIFHQSWIL